MMHIRFGCFVSLNCLSDLMPANFVDPVRHKFTGTFPANSIFGGRGVPQALVLKRTFLVAAPTLTFQVLGRLEEGLPK